MLSYELLFWFMSGLFAMCLCEIAILKCEVNEYEKENEKKERSEDFQVDGCR